MVAPAIFSGDFGVSDLGMMMGGVFMFYLIINIL